MYDQTIEHQPTTKSANTNGGKPTAKRHAQHIGAREARNRFANLIGQVHFGGEIVIVERSGRPMVAMIPIELYEQLIGEQPLQTSNEQVTEPLLGAFPELAILTEDDFSWSKQLWDNGVEKQEHILVGKEV